eukprot:g3210.t1
MKVKRQKCSNASEVASTTTNTTTTTTTANIVKIEFEANTKLEVLWEVTGDASATDDEGSTQEVWWRCTVLGSAGSHHTLQDGVDTESLPLYNIEYDAMPTLGFAERSASSVIFVGPYSLYDPDLDVILPFRKEGSLWTPDEKKDCSTGSFAVAETSIMSSKAGFDRQVIENAVNMTITRVYTKHEKALERLSPESQLAAVDKIVEGKKLLTDALCKHLKRKYDQITTERGSPLTTLEIDAGDIRAALEDASHASV